MLRKYLQMIAWLVQIRRFQLFQQFNSQKPESINSTLRNKNRSVLDGLPLFYFCADTFDDPVNWVKHSVGFNFYFVLSVIV